MSEVLEQPVADIDHGGCQPVASEQCARLETSRRRAKASHPSVARPWVLAELVQPERRSAQLTGDEQMIADPSATAQYRAVLTHAEQRNRDRQHARSGHVAA